MAKRRAPIDLPQVLALKEAADYLNIGRSTLYRMAENGQIPAFRVGWGWRFTVTTLDKWRFERDSGAHLLERWRH